MRRFLRWLFGIPDLRAMTLEVVTIGPGDSIIMQTEDFLTRKQARMVSRQVEQILSMREGSVGILDGTRWTFSVIKHAPLSDTMMIETTGTEEQPS